MGKISNKMHHLPGFQHNWTRVNGVTDISPNYNTLIITVSWGPLILDLLVIAVIIAHLFFHACLVFFFFSLFISFLNKSLFFSFKLIGACLVLLIFKSQFMHVGFR